jgi:cyclopropane fatty-acyl-phospholipid synthase-like methyltransferase
MDINMRKPKPSDKPAGFANPAATWNERFQGEEFLFGTEPNNWLREQVHTLPAGGRVLSVADGEGRNSIWLARQGFRVDAFDISDVGVAKARAWAAREGLAGKIDYAVCDCDAVAWPAAMYDAVVAIFIQFADPATRARLFARMAAALKPGGVLVLQGYTPQQLQNKTGGPPRVEHLYTEAMLRDSFAGLEIVALREYEAELAEGTAHRGRSALIGLVARRPLA